MRPFPAAATDVSWLMAEKSLVNDVAEMLAAAAVVGAAVGAEADVVAVLTLEELDDLEELLQATNPKVVTAATDSAAARFTEKLMVMFSLVCEQRWTFRRSADVHGMETSVNEALKFVAVT